MPVTVDTFDTPQKRRQLRGFRRSGGRIPVTVDILDTLQGHRVKERGQVRGWRRRDTGERLRPLVSAVRMHRMDFESPP